MQKQKAHKQNIRDINDISNTSKRTNSQFSSNDSVLSLYPRHFGSHTPTAISSHSYSIFLVFKFVFNPCNLYCRRYCTCSSSNAGGGGGSSVKIIAKNPQTQITEITNDFWCVHTFDCAPTFTFHKATPPPMTSVLIIPVDARSPFSQHQRSYLGRSGRPAPGRPLNPSCTAGRGTAGGRTRRPSSASSRSSVSPGPEGRRPRSRWSSPPARTCRPACDRSALTSRGLLRHRPHTTRSPSPTDSSRSQLPILLLHNKQTARLPSNLRQTTRECVFLVKRGDFRSRDKGGGHTIRCVIAKTPFCIVHADFAAVSFAESQLLPIKVSHCVY